MKSETAFFIAIGAAVTAISAIVVGLAFTFVEKAPEVDTSDLSNYLKFYENNNLANDQFTVLDVYMRPDNTFLQGLYYDDKTGIFWEGSGNYGQSKVRYLKLDEETKKLNYDTTVPQYVYGSNVFGEGIAPLNDYQIVALTWKSGLVYILDQATLMLNKTIPLFTGAKEGWGLTNFPGDTSNSNNNLFVSDGSSTIFEINGDTLKTVRSFIVYDGSGNKVSKINELEYVDGLIWANIWFSDEIIAIDPASGSVVKSYNMAPLKTTESAFQYSAKNGRDNSDVLNGIAHNPTDDTFYITGKKWYLMFKVKFN